MGPVSERTVQAVLMRWAMESKSHVYVLPNSNGFFQWEADLLSVTRAGLVHEYEIKLNRADYRRDGIKKLKHQMLMAASVAGPAYFWYVTHGFDIEPPEHAGWIRVGQVAAGWVVDVRREAPRLRSWKLDDWHQLALARALSFRITNSWCRSEGVVARIATSGLIVAEEGEPAGEPAGDEGE